MSRLRRICRLDLRPTPPSPPDPLWSDWKWIG